MANILLFLHQFHKENSCEFGNWLWFPLPFTSSESSLDGRRPLPPSHIFTRPTTLPGIIQHGEDNFQMGQCMYFGTFYFGTHKLYREDICFNVSIAFTQSFHVAYRLTLKCCWLSFSTCKIVVSNN